VSATEPTFVIGRAFGTVVVTVRGDLDAAALGRLDGVLTDLIAGQGNLAVSVDLTRATGEPEALHAFVSVQRERFCGTNLTISEPHPAGRGQAQARR
jgi:hypothetical protein